MFRMWKKSLVFRDFDNTYKCEPCDVIVDIDKMPNWLSVI